MQNKALTLFFGTYYNIIIHQEKVEREKVFFGLFNKTLEINKQKILLTYLFQ